MINSLEVKEFLSNMFLDKTKLLSYEQKETILETLKIINIVEGLK